MSGTWPGFSADWEESSEYQEAKARARLERQANTSQPIRSDYVAELGYVRLTGGGIVCGDCGARYPRYDGSVMRGHRKRCPVAPREVYVPGVCDA